MMSIVCNTTETFRDDYKFRNSEESIQRWPFPFFEDKYEYTMNLEPHVKVPGTVHAANFDIDEHYVSEMKERAIASEERLGQHFKALPNMMQAQWDLLELIMESYATDDPENFTLSVDGANWTWENKLLNLKDTLPSATRRPCHTSQWNTSLVRLRASGLLWMTATIPSIGPLLWRPNAQIIHRASILA
jgi:hypothetical protein